jgi:hypothetical protein
LQERYESEGQAVVEAALQELEAQMATARDSQVAALEEHPHALTILLRSGNRQEAIELYQRRSGVSWQAALNAIKELERTLE